LLVTDMSGERAKAAIGSGNIDTADNVAVFTPGMNSRVDRGSLAGYVGDMERLRVRVQDETHRAGGHATVAVVTH
jgi:hypothetical protein